ncbi:MAG: formyltransferase family protein, partial [Candidatus Saccharibacteria bacterium]|nr:formyltransferase family protein [Candidatus Saccharibacteria bacterium]
MSKIIFFGNGPLADFTKAELEKTHEIIFHAHNKADLVEAARLKAEFPKARGVLASFGVLIRSDFLELFEPEGILNLHPSLLPDYRGASPIESAILDGKNDFSYSIMKLAKAMDAGPIYYQETFAGLLEEVLGGDEDPKTAIYRRLATAGAKWLSENLEKLPEAAAQDETKATFCGKFDKSMSILEPEKHSAAEILRQIIAFQSFPKPKYTFYDRNCIVLRAHAVEMADLVSD